MKDASQFRDRATEEAFRLAWFASRHLPESSVRSAFMIAADQAYRRNGLGVQRLRMNLARVRPDYSAAQLEKLTRDGMHSYMRYWMEAFRLPSWTSEQIRNRFYLDNTKMLDDAVATGTGVIMVPGHLANWDSAGAWASDRYGGLATVAERLKPEGLFDQFLEYRRQLGMEVIPLGDPNAVRSLARTLQRGGMVALLGDRDFPSPPRCPLGRQTRRYCEPRGGPGPAAGLRGAAAEAGRAAGLLRLFSGVGGGRGSGRGLPGADTGPGARSDCGR